MVDKLSREDLLKVLAKVAVKDKPVRKKADRSEEQQQELKERLARMRETSLANRVAKAEAKKMTREALSDEPSQIQTALDLAKPKEDLFEKRYGTQFEKMTETLGMLNTHLIDIKEMKKSKAEARRLEKEARDKTVDEKPVKPPTSMQMTVEEKKVDISNSISAGWGTKPAQPISYIPVDTHTQPTLSTPGPFKISDFKRMNFNGGRKR